GGLERPLVAVLRPDRLSVAASRVEGPGPDLLVDRVPANPLGASVDRDTVQGGGELRDDEVLVLRPVEGGVARLPLLALARPFTDQPLAVLQVLGVRRRLDPPPAP